MNCVSVHLLMKTEHRRDDVETNDAKVAGGVR
jgi:hypothetical protein